MGRVQNDWISFFDQIRKKVHGEIAAVTSFNGVKGVDFKRLVEIVEANDNID